MDTQILPDKAKKHKKLFEQVFINPYGYEVNGSKYFLTLYKKSKKTTGYSIITSEQFNNEDAMEAFEHLIIYTIFVNNFFSIGEKRARISADYFFIPAKKIDQYLQVHGMDEILKKGKNILIEYGDLQEEFKNIANEYTHYYDTTILGRNEISKDDIKQLLTVLSHLNRIQYLQGKKFIESYNELKLLEKEMKETNISKSIPPDNLKFLTELLSSKKDTEITLRDLDVEKEIEHLEVNEQIKILVSEFKKAGYEKMPRYKQDLRYPKL
ncbi:hypothetical protein [Bacillus sp. KH172YL63]|uniref:hypothetical protein n=1 Tax=Bacillus sp. KH172YL63 TaxID=2709784 RepID=UPI0013E499D7|nr:hypothetical protein [Bacillus sp. KH172YL63]BCB02178.1 hypothetical protein KH172YL63_03110 [Bacillus sp. KH172YL63]